MSQPPENQQQYGSILTILGENAEQNGKLKNKQITFTHIAIGDANDTYVQPDRKQTALVNELARIPVNSVDVLQPTPDSTPMLKVEAILPDDVNDLIIREFAAVATFDGNTYFHAVGNCARIYVPAPVNNGNVSTPVTLEMIFVITSAEPIVEIDPNVVTASRHFVHNQVNNSDERLAQTIIDQNGRDWFIDDGFLVTKENSDYNVKNGSGYVSGHRIYLESDQNIPVINKPSFIYINALREETSSGEKITDFNLIVSENEIDDFIDTEGEIHFVCKIAQVLEDGSVIDHRPLSLVEKRSRLTVKASEMPSYPSEQSIYDALDKAVRVKAARVLIDDLICNLTQKREFHGLRNCRITFTGCEITVEDLDERLIFVDPVNCTFESDCSEIKGAVQSQQYAIDNPISDVFPVIKLVRPYFCRTENFFGHQVRSIVEHEAAKFCTATGNHVKGGLTESAENGAGISYGVNYMSGVVFSSGSHNLAYGNSAEDHGSAVLGGMDTHSLLAFANVGENLHDNGLYLSSGSGSISFANAFRKVAGAGVKSRGGNNLAVLNTVDNANVAVDVTGNGVTPDEKGANGASNLLALNSASKSRAHDFRITTQDGLKTRDSIMALNASNNHLGLGEYTPLKLSSKEGALVIANLIGDTKADYCLMASGTEDDGNEIIVSANLWGGGLRFASRLNNTDKYIYGLNLHKSGIKGIEARELDVGALIGNVSDLDQEVATISNVYNSTKAILTGNVGLIAGHSMPGEILAEANYNGQMPWPANYAPIRPLQLYESGGKVFISVPDGLGGFRFSEISLLAT